MDAAQHSTTHKRPKTKQHAQTAFDSDQSNVLQCTGAEMAPWYTRLSLIVLLHVLARACYVSLPTEQCACWRQFNVTLLANSEHASMSDMLEGNRAVSCCRLNRTSTSCRAWSSCAAAMAVLAAYHTLNDSVRWSKASTQHYIKAQPEVLPKPFDGKWHTLMAPHPTQARDDTERVHSPPVWCCALVQCRQHPLGQISA